MLKPPNHQSFDLTLGKINDKRNFDLLSLSRVLRIVRRDFTHKRPESQLPFCGCGKKEAGETSHVRAKTTLFFFAPTPEKHPRDFANDEKNEGEGLGNEFLTSGGSQLVAS
jgi:hypothetical protein